MKLTELQSLFVSQVLSTDQRTLRLAWSESLQPLLGAALLPQRAEVTEGICEPTEARITCLSTARLLPLHELPGQPFALQLLTGQGELRSFALVVTEATQGCSDGALTAVHLVGRDAMSLMAERRRLRCFHQPGVTGVVDEVLAGWRQDGLSACFTHTWLGVDAQRHLLPEGVIQHPDESDAGFVQRLLRAEGIAWFWRPCAQGPGSHGSLPCQEMVLFDDARRLPAAAPEVLRYHRRDASLPADTIDLLAPQWRLVPAGAALRGWSPGLGQELGAADAHTGGALARALGSARVCLPDAGGGQDGLARQLVAQERHQRFRARALHGRSGVRTLAPGTYQRIEDFPGFDELQESERECTTVRVEHLAFNNLPAELHTAAQALLGGHEWPEWARSAPSEAIGHGRDARSPHRYVNRFMAVPRDVPIAPPPLLEHEQPRLRPLTGIVLAGQGLHADTDALGRSRVRLLGGPSGADTTAWVRHRTPWAGEGVGLSTVLRPGTEVDIEWLGADRPVIAGCHYNAATPPPRVAHCAGLPPNLSQTALVGQELGTRRQQHLLLDDFPGRLMAQLASEAGHSALSLGELGTPRCEGRTEPRGNGFELRSDAAGAIRTARALLLSAWARLEACGGQLDAQEHVALMQECLELFKSLGRYAAQHQGLAGDEAAQEKLLADVKAAPGGSNVDPHGEDGAPTLSLTAPAGIAATTPKTILSYAGVNIDSVAQQHLQWTAGQRLTAHAGQGIAWFAHHGGISAIAHHGTWLMQSQQGDIEANAAQNIRWTATGGQLVGMARKIVLVAEDGSFMQIGEGGITLGTQGTIAHKSARYTHSAAATLEADLPTFAQGAADQRFVLRYGGRDGPVAAQRRFEIRLGDGSVVTGTSDAEGRTEVLQRDAMHIAHIRILSDD